MRRNVRYRVVVRGKIAKRRAKKTATALIVVVAAACCLVGFGRAAGSVRRSVSSAEWTKWRLVAVDASGLPAASADAVVKVAAVENNTEMTAVDVATLETKISAAFPELRDVKARRNWLTHRLGIKAQRRIPSAKLVSRDKTIGYMDERGEIYKTEPEPPQTLITVGVPDGFSAGHFKPETAAFIKNLRDMDGLPAKPVEISPDKEESSFSVRLAEGSEVNWGGLEHTGEKIARLAQVYGQAAQKLVGPYKINMRYFEDGRILVKQAQQL